MSTILEIKGLRGGYIPGVEILQGIDLCLQQGEAVGIIGLNGSGKSTLGKAVMNMIPLRQGEIVYEGRLVTHLPTNELARNGIAIMQQGGQVFRDLSVWDNLQLAFGNNKDNIFMSRLKFLIPIIAMPEKVLKSEIADKLSGGQRHQLALAMVLAQRPKLIILDEPSAGLSPRAVDEMYVQLTQLCSNLDVSVILIEQNVYKAIGFCNRCLLLQQGAIVKEIINKDISQIESVMFKNIII